MDSRYNVYFEGQLLDGHAPESARDKLGRLFKADQATVDRLFNGKRQLLKRNCDKATALNYKQAMEKAGALAVIAAVPAASEEAPPATPDSDKTMSAAERIASLANAPDTGNFGATEPAPVEYETRHADEDNSALQLTPEGTEVLRPEERPQLATREIDTSGLSLGAAAERLSEPVARAAKGPDTAHLSMGEVGDTIPTLPSASAPVNPDTGYLGLSPAGTDFSDCAPADAEVPQVDLSDIDLAPSGADVLEEQYRKKPTGQPPATDHLSLED